MLKNDYARIRDILLSEVDSSYENVIKNHFLLAEDVKTFYNEKQEGYVNIIKIKFNTQEDEVIFETDEGKDTFSISPEAINEINTITDYDNSILSRKSLSDYNRKDKFEGVESMVVIDKYDQLDRDEEVVKSHIYFSSMHFPTISFDSTQDKYKLIEQWMRNDNERGNPFEIEEVNSSLDDEMLVILKNRISNEKLFFNITLIDPANESCYVAKMIPEVANAFDEFKTTGMCDTPSKSFDDYLRGGAEREAKILQMNDTPFANSHPLGIKNDNSLSKGK